MGRACWLNLRLNSLKSKTYIVRKFKIHQSINIMKSKLHNIIVMLAMLALSTLNSEFSTARAQSATAFTYQGQIQNNGSPANGNYDLAFDLFNAVNNGTAVAPSLTNYATPVSNGLFTVTLDFGAGVFTGSNNWLDISVRPNGASNAFIELTPRQLLTPAPQSIYAMNAGTAANAASTSNFSGTITGDVSGTQEATVVSSVGGQTAASIAQGVIAANGATSSNTPGAIVARDASGNFCAGSVTLSSNLYLPFPATIYSGTNAVMIFQDISYFAGGAGPAATNLNDVGIGFNALHTGIPSTGANNVAIGAFALQDDTTGSYNKADGAYALQFNTTGSYNTAEGSYALQLNTTGSENTAIGNGALNANNTGSENTASGTGALFFNTTASGNTADGRSALRNNTTGFNNTAGGYDALLNNTSGSFNTADGYGALDDSMGTSNIGIGYLAGGGLQTGGNDIYIGNQGTGENFAPNESDTIRIGDTNLQTTKTYIAGIWETALGSNAQTVVVDSGGHLGTIPISSGSGVCSVLPSGDITVTTVGCVVTVGSDATPLDTFSTIVSRDTNGSFNANNIALGSAVNCPSPLQSGVLNLPPTQGSGATTLLAGGITLGDSCNSPFLHGFGVDNFFGGLDAGNFTLTGSDNAGVGAYALQSDAAGSNNTANGFAALSSVTFGANNIGIGFNAGGSLATGNNDIYIGNQGAGCNFNSAENNTIRIGSIDNTTCTGSNNTASTYIAGIYDNGSLDGTQVPVEVDECGHLGVVCSSERYKQNIRSMDGASDELLSLRPVTYQYKPGLDPKARPQFGLVAEEVDKVDPNLVVHDARHGIYTVRYEAVNAMLLNEFLKQHRKVEAQSAEIQDLKQSVADLKQMVQSLVEKK